MRTWLILLALLVILCAVASYKDHRATRNKRNLMQSKSLYPRSAYDAPEPQEQLNEVVEENDEEGNDDKDHDDKDHDDKDQECPVHSIDHCKADDLGSEHGLHILCGEKAKEKALAARRVVHDSKSIGIATHSTAPGLSGYVLISVQLLTDVIDGKSTGAPYVYMSKNDWTEKDLKKDENVSILFSRSCIDKTCDSLPLKAKDPGCDQAILFGKMKKVDPNSAEHKSAREELFKKFPGLADVNQEEYVLRRINIEAVFVPDHRGRSIEVPKEIYENIVIDSQDSHVGNDVSAPPQIDD